MTTQTRPRIDEFLLAVLWLLSGGVWAYFSISGFSDNLIRADKINLPGFVLSYFFACLAVFGISYSLSVFWRIPSRPPLWVENYGAVFRATVLIVGFFFSMFTFVILVMNLFTNDNANLILGWGIAAGTGVLILAIYMILSAMRLLEPFLFLIEIENEIGQAEPQVKAHPLLRWLLGLNRLQHFFFASNQSSRRGDRLYGPLLTEADLKTSIIEENDKMPSRAGLEKTLVAHGGWHVNTMGFTSNGSVIFAASTGGVVHFQAGGRKGIMFPPEIKFWEWRTGKTQTASLGKTQTFLTRAYRTPLSLHKYDFLVPSGGGRFAWATPKNVIVGDWQSDRTQTLNHDDMLEVEGKNGFVPIAFNSEGSKIAWCDTSGQTHYWDLDSDRVHPLRRYPAGTDGETGVWGLSFSPDGTKIATIAERGVLLQNVYTGWRWFAENNPAHEKITAFAFDYNGLQMAVAMLAKPEAVRPPSKNGRTNGAMQPEGVTDSDGQKWLPLVRLWDLRVADYVDLVGGSSPFREVAFSPDNRMLAVVDDAGILRLWDIVPDSQLNKPPRQVLQLDLGLTGRKTVVGFSPDMQNLICATDNRILIWNLQKVRKEYALTASLN